MAGRGSRAVRRQGRDESCPYDFAPRSGREPRARISAMYCLIVPSTDSLNETLPSAISRSAVSPGLLSHFPRGVARPASWRARSAPRITKANRLGTLSKQSSTVTRANLASRARCEVGIIGRKRAKSRARSGGGRASFGARVLTSAAFPWFRPGPGLQRFRLTPRLEVLYLVLSALSVGGERPEELMKCSRLLSTGVI